MKRATRTHAKKTDRSRTKKKRPASAALKKALRTRIGKLTHATPSSRRAPTVPAKPVKKLSRTELSFYKKLLLAGRSRIGDEIKHITGENLMRSQKDVTGELSGYALHMADVASDNYEREFSLGVASEEQRILYLIDEALKRIEDKTYGACIACGCRIPKNRLRALPYAKMCIPCQERLEVRQSAREL